MVSHCDAPSSCLYDFQCEYFEWDELNATAEQCRRICDDLNAKDLEVSLTEIFTGAHESTCQRTCNGASASCNCHLREASKYANEVQFLVDCLKSTNWQVQFAALLGVQYTARNYPLALISNIAGVFEGIHLGIENLRSGVSKNAIITAGHMARGVGKYLTKDIIAETLVVLLKKASSDKRFVGGAALESCQALCTRKWGCSMVHTFGALVNIVSEKSKRAAMMAKLAEVLWFAINDAKNHDANPGSNVDLGPDIIQTLFPPISILLVERLPAPKEFGRKSLATLQNHWDMHFASTVGDFLAFVHNTMKSMPESQRAALFKAISQIRVVKPDGSENGDLRGRIGRSAMRLGVANKEGLVAGKPYRSSSLCQRACPPLNVSTKSVSNDCPLFRKEVTSDTADSPRNPDTTSSPPIEVFVPSKPPPQTSNSTASPLCTTDAPPQLIITPTVPETKEQENDKPTTSFDHNHSSDASKSVRPAYKPPQLPNLLRHDLSAPECASKSIVSPSSCPVKIQRVETVDANRRVGRFNPPQNKRTANEGLTRVKATGRSDIPTSLTVPRSLMKEKRPPVSLRANTRGSRYGPVSARQLPKCDRRDSDWSVRSSSTTGSSQSAYGRLRQFTAGVKSTYARPNDRPTKSEIFTKELSQCDVGSYRGTKSSSTEVKQAWTSMTLPGRMNETRVDDVRLGLRREGRVRSLTVSPGQPLPPRCDQVCVNRSNSGNISLRGGAHHPNCFTTNGFAVRTDLPARPPRAPVSREQSTIYGHRSHGHPSYPQKRPGEQICSQCNCSSYNSSTYSRFASARFTPTTLRSSPPSSSPPLRRSHSQPPRPMRWRL